MSKALAVAHDSQRMRPDRAGYVRASSNTQTQKDRVMGFIVRLLAKVMGHPRFDAPAGSVFDYIRRRDPVLADDLQRAAELQDEVNLVVNPYRTPDEEARYQEYRRRRLVPFQ